jgi:hypothetical protein
MTDKNDDKSHPHSSAFGFLFEGKNNEYDEEYKDYIEGKSLDEIWEQAYGKGDLEERKAMKEARKLRADYGESELNIVQCVMCGSLDVPNVDLDLELKSKNNRLKSVKVRGGQCVQCGEGYSRGQDIRAKEMIEKLLNEM